MRTAESGASLIETLVAFGLAVAVSTVALSLFTFHQRLGRAQLDDSSVQQAQRAAHRELRRTLRAAGRGGFSALRPERAVHVEKDVAPGHPVGARTAAAGTDVLVVRGVMNGPLYWVEDSAFDPATGRGWVEVRAEAANGVLQPLAMLQDAGAAGDDALLLLTGAGAAHAVAPITDMEASGRGRSRTLTVHVHGDPSRGPIAAAYVGMSSGGAWPADRLSAADRVGVLEEWRFYIHPGDPQSGRGPQLARARFYPGTETAWRRWNPNLLQPIADDVVDLEVTLDQAADGRGFTAVVLSTARTGGLAGSAQGVERSARSVVRLRNLR